MLEFKFDTQLLIEGHDLDEDAINEYFTTHFKGDCLLARHRRGEHGTPGTGPAGLRPLTEKELIRGRR